GRVTALRARVVSPLGGALMNAAAGPPWNHARLLPGAYVVPACEIAVTGALTTTAPVAAYRGAGRPEACFFIERLMDTGARALGIDPAEIRRRNFVPADRFPWRTVTGQVYDSGDYPAALERALAAADYSALRKAQAERRKRREIVGVGLASYVEPCALGWESGSLRVERSGRVTAITGSSAHGQGHETTGLEASTYFQPEGEVWSFGCVVCALSIEAETGRLVIERLVWVDDAGTIINPLLAEGQLHGALAQGLGQTLLEAIVYDADG